MRLPLRFLVPFVIYGLSLVHAQTTEICYPGGRIRCLQTFTTPSSTGIQFGFAFPLSCDTIHTGEFIGQINAPLSAKWVGFDLGPGMIGNPLIVAWRYPENQVKFSVRQASSYTQPVPFTTGPVITTIATKFLTGRWQWTFRCQNCLSWVINGNAGSIDVNNYSLFGWAYSPQDVYTPSNPNTDFPMSTDFGIYAVNVPAAKHANYPVYLLP